MYVCMYDVDGMNDNEYVFSLQKNSMLLTKT